jgi:hypothetical protein
MSHRCLEFADIFGKRPQRRLRGFGIATRERRARVLGGDEIGVRMLRVFRKVSPRSTILYRSFDYERRRARRVADAREAAE